MRWELGTGRHKGAGRLKGSGKSTCEESEHSREPSEAEPALPAVAFEARGQQTWMDIWIPCGFFLTIWTRVKGPYAKELCQAYNM